MKKILFGVAAFAIMCVAACTTKSTTENVVENDSVVADTVENVDSTLVVDSVVVDSTEAEVVE
jgi:hypothetical protein